MITTQHFVRFAEPIPPLSMQAMSFFPSSSPEPAPPRHFVISQPSSPTYQSRIDDDSFLSSDLDVSFASVSVNSEPSSPTEEFMFPPPSTTSLKGPLAVFAVPYPSEMDISPAPSRTSETDMPPPQSRSGRRGMPIRSRSNTIGPMRTSHTKQSSIDDRLFGREISNASVSPPVSKTIKTSAPILESLFESSPSTTKPLSGRQRAGLPLGWLQPSGSGLAARMAKRPGCIFSQNSIGDSSPEVSMRCDSMDLDSPRPVVASLPDEFITSSPLKPEKASHDFGSLFFDSTSPTIDFSKRQTQKRSPTPEQQPFGAIPIPPSAGKGRHRSSSPVDSPSINRGVSTRTFERFATTGSQGPLFNLTAASKLPLGKRATAPQRPAMNPLVSCDTKGATIRGPKSAYAGLYGPSGKRMPTAMPGLPTAPRRAFSAVGPQPPHPTSNSSQMLMFDPSDEEGNDTELEEEDSAIGGVDGSSPAVHAFKARTHARAASYMNPPKTSGLFAGKSMMEKLTECMGANGKEEEDLPTGGRVTSFPVHHGSEAHGKVLPCRGVKEDGLMRIDPKTMQALLRGDYDDKLDKFHVIDCRFDYEYDGGHIEGAVNLNTNAAIEDFFFHENAPPSPCSSGQNSAGARTVIVLHCEFSAKRAPTFAKHLRCQDRKRNQESYPNIHYPEVYILEGGYSAFYNAFPEECGGYVEMDDPKHIRARCEDLNNFRRWERTKSYTYGELPSKNQSGPTRHTSSNSVPTLAPAISLISGNTTSTNAVGRQAGASARAELTVLEEDVGDSSFSQGEGDSPCPPSFKVGGGSNRFAPPSNKPLGRLPLLGRAATFSPAMMLGRC